MATHQRAGTLAFGLVGVCGQVELRVGQGRPRDALEERSGDGVEGAGRRARCDDMAVEMMQEPDRRRVFRPEWYRGSSDATAD